jgi:adenosine deaminase
MPVKTDIHTHFAGILSGQELIELAIEHDLAIDQYLAEKIGLSSDEDFRVSELSSAQRHQLKELLELAPDKQSLFDDLEDVYGARAFITKNPSMFVPMMEKIAQSYQEQGVEYVEMSFAGIINNPEFIKQAHEAIPRIEQETGVKLRFLGALWRHSDHEWNMDEVDRLKKVALSLYVVGIDVMGHEKNPIRELTEPLEEIVRFASHNVPGFQVRIHAGENPYCSAPPSSIDEWNFNNAHEAVQIVDSARKDENGSSMGQYGDQICIRLGHGRYGLHEETLKLMAETGAVSELCLTSNHLLNHADCYLGPFNLYAQHEVDFVLASDGYGMYGTTQPSEFDKASKAGMSDKAKAIVQDTETQIIAEDEYRTIEKQKIWSRHEKNCALKGVDPYDDLANVDYTTHDREPRFNESVEVEKARATQLAVETLEADLTTLGISVDRDEVNSILESKTPILFSGASRTSWSRVSPEQQQEVELALKEYINQLDPSENVIVTGATDFGFEAVVHRIVEEINSELPEDERFDVIGAVTLELNPDLVREGTLSHALILENSGAPAKTWMDQSPALMDMIEKSSGKIVFGGGGQVIRDMIVDANGRGLISNGQAFLFNGPEGASTELSPKYPLASFSDGEQLIMRSHGIIPDRNPTLKVEPVAHA